MERVERKGNLFIKILSRVIVIGGILAAVWYGCSRIPYFVVKQNLALQYGFTYQNYEDVVEKREKYVSEAYYFSLQESEAIQQRQILSEHQVKCELFYVELGEYDGDGAIPYTIVYELSFEDGALPTERVHMEGKQEIERSLGIWWKVKADDVEHSCLFTEDVEEFTERLYEAEHSHTGHSHEHE